MGDGAPRGGDVVLDRRGGCVVVRRDEHDSEIGVVAEEALVLGAGEGQVQCLERSCDRAAFGPGIDELADGVDDLAGVVALARAEPARAIDQERAVDAGAAAQEPAVARALAAVPAGVRGDDAEVQVGDPVELGDHLGDHRGERGVEALAVRGHGR
jgi:hypothetical protein